MSEKILGYVLIAIGVIVIVFSAVNVSYVFTKRSLPVSVFELSGISLDLGGLIGSDLSVEEKAMIEQGDISTKAELISAEVLNTPLNYVAHLLFMGFIAGIGFKVAKLGVMLVRPIKVKLKEEKPS